MHIAIDILAGIILLSFFAAGCHKGILLSLLGVFRVVACYGVAYFSGRYVGYWAGTTFHRPMLVTIPVVTIFTFALVALLFRIIMHSIRRHRQKEGGEENLQMPAPCCLLGGSINLAAGTVSLILLFWVVDLFSVGMSGSSIPGSGRSNFSRFARRAIYEAAHTVISRKSDPAQAAALSRTISNPDRSMEHLENVIAADSVQQLLSDTAFAKDLLSSDADQIGQNASLQGLYNDRATLDELRELGIVSGYETKSGLCRKLAALGQNEKIYASIENLQNKQLLNTGCITLLIRDPDFDAIITELVR